jgi:DNA-binding NtrC family response regulator
MQVGAYAASVRRLSLVSDSVEALVARDQGRVQKLHRRVLVVDDQRSSRLAIEQRIAECVNPFGIAVDSAESIADAVGMHRARGYAAVLTDYHLGSDSGLDLLVRLGRGPRGVVVTGRVQTHRIEEMARYLDARVFAIPVEPEQWLALAQHVHALVDGVIPARG